MRDRWVIQRLACVRHVWPWRTYATRSHGDSSKLVAPTNAVGVQLLERGLHRQVFPPTSAYIPPPVDPFALSLCQGHLEQHGLHASKASQLKPTSFTLPPLQGRDLGEHFWAMGHHQIQPWQEYADLLASIEIPEPPREHSTDASASWDVESWLALDESLRAEVPLRPATLVRMHGWVKYPYIRTADGQVAGLGAPESVPFPDYEDVALVLDVEVMTRVSPYPVMATAAGPHAWYTWVSPWLVQEGPRCESVEHLIPLGGEDAPPRLVVGHNAGFDRAAVLDEYTLRMTRLRWLDTMSLHVATNGISSPQRAAWTQHTRARAEKQLDQWFDAQRVEKDTRAHIRQLLGSGVGGVEDEDAIALPVHVLEEVGAERSAAADDSEHSQVLWQDVTSQNSLADVAALHCNIHLDKTQRDVFVEAESRDEVAAQLPALLAYCASDVRTTAAVFRKVWPAFMRNCPHPATLAGVLGLGSTFLPVDASWPAYLRSATARFDEMNAHVVSTLQHLATQLMQDGTQAIDAGAGERWWETDPWYAQLDWTPKRPKVHDGSVLVPAWWRDKIVHVKKLGKRNKIVAQLLQLQCDGARVVYDDTHRRWAVERHGEWEALPSSPLSRAVLEKYEVTSEAGRLGEEALAAVIDGADDATDKMRAVALAVRDGGETKAVHPSLAQLDWRLVPFHDPTQPQPWWPKWYWELYDASEQGIEVTIRTKIAPLLLKIAWDGQPIRRSREHGWVYRSDGVRDDKAPLTFALAADAALAKDAHTYYKLPHANGDGSNVGNPFSKGFLPMFENGRLQSLHPSTTSADAARLALEMNAQCSYWISARDRIEKQMVVWDGDAETRMGFERDGAQRGLILPQVITMGTVTRRAIEKTWLTASNAKKNRIGSELKSMVRAPRGWSIVGADVDSEELWICSVMGDAQFGMHGATAIGWMTLEGSKAQGTDLHSKTAAILGTSRDQAKVFNYSRIYGAGIKHAMQLLLKANPSMPLEEAARRAKQLYAATKGQTTRTSAFFGRRFWFGGSESFVFNKLEEIALSEHPRTPALDCGITAALLKQYLPKVRGNASVQERGDYMPSRINWVVQSSGVDYLHMLITAMSYLCETYGIDARFMLSVHDEVRYLARDEDRYRAALALQIANLWTRAMFAFKLNMDDLPESCAFFASVDIDHVLRKETDDPCITPSQPHAIPPGESLDIHAILAKTKGTLGEAKTTRLHHKGAPPPPGQHRCVGEAGLLFLQAQAASDVDEVRALHQRVQRREQRREQRGVRAFCTSAGASRKPRALGTMLALAEMLPQRRRRGEEELDGASSDVALEKQQRQQCQQQQQQQQPARGKGPGQGRVRTAAACRPKSASGGTTERGPRLYLSGALLPPSLFNKPMLRYKPTQPIHTTMMIHARRKARIKRLERWDEIQEIKYLAEREAHARVRDGFFERTSEWHGRYAPYERELQAQFQRERERAAMVFTPEQLRRAMAARRARMRYKRWRRTCSA